MILSEADPLLAEDKEPLVTSRTDNHHVETMATTEDTPVISLSPRRRVRGTTYFYPINSLKLEASSNSCYPRCCTLFSLCGMIFMLFIGLYATFSVCYTHNCWTKQEVSIVQKNALGSGAMYFVSFVVSLFFWARQIFREKRKSRTRGIGDDDDDDGGL